MTRRWGKTVALSLAAALAMAALTGCGGKMDEANSGIGEQASAKPALGKAALSSDRPAAVQIVQASDQAAGDMAGQGQLISVDSIESVQVAQIPVEETRTEPLLASSPSDRPAIENLVSWLRNAGKGQPLAADEESTLRPHVQVGIALKDGTNITLEPVCMLDPATNGADCREKEGQVRLYKSGVKQPSVIVSPELAEWILRGYKYDTTMVWHSDNPRAIGRSASGELSLVQQSAERIGRLGAPSCVGTEDDYRMTGDYRMMFKNADGSSQTVRSFDGLTVIYPYLETIELEKLQFAEFEAFAFVPAYADCHGLEFYMFGVHDGEAFPFSFRIGDAEQSTFATSPVHLLEVADGKLVVTGGTAAGGGEYPIRYTFQPDLQAKAMVLTDRRNIPPE